VNKDEYNGRGREREGKVRKGRERKGERRGEGTEGRRGPRIQPPPWASQDLGPSLPVIVKNDSNTMAVSDKNHAWRLTISYY